MAELPFQGYLGMELNFVETLRCRVLLVMEAAQTFWFEDSVLLCWHTRSVWIWSLGICVQLNVYFG